MKKIGESMWIVPAVMVVIGFITGGLYNEYELEGLYYTCTTCFIIGILWIPVNIAIRQIIKLFK